jgi:hypothetical protein
MTFDNGGDLDDHPEASAWPLPLLFCSFFLFTVVSVNALSRGDVREGVD